jgi:hypothetical protein
MIRLSRFEPERGLIFPFVDNVRPFPKVTTRRFSSSVPPCADKPSGNATLSLSLNYLSGLSAKPPEEGGGAVRTSARAPDSPFRGTVSVERKVEGRDSSAFHVSKVPNTREHPHRLQMVNLSRNILYKTWFPLARKGAFRGYQPVGWETSRNFFRQQLRSNGFSDLNHKTTSAGANSAVELQTARWRALEGSRLFRKADYSFRIDAFAMQ